MTRSHTIVIIALALALAGCLHGSAVDPTPSPIPEGTSPRAAILGREPTDRDCFTNAFDLVELPDPPTLARHVATISHPPAWLPSGGFLGTPAQLAEAVHGLLIPGDPLTAWVLVADADGPRADRWFPLVARTGQRIWYREGWVRRCA